MATQNKSRVVTASAVAALWRARVKKCCNLKRNHLMSLLLCSNSISKTYFLHRGYSRSAANFFLSYRSSARPCCRHSRRCHRKLFAGPHSPRDRTPWCPGGTRCQRLALLFNNRDTHTRTKLIMARLTLKTLRVKGTYAAERSPGTPGGPRPRRPSGPWTAASAGGV